MLHRALEKVVIFCMLVVLFLSAYSFVFAQGDSSEILFAEPEMSKEDMFLSAEEESAKTSRKESGIVTSDFSVSPIVANEKAKPRDIIKKELLITNNTEQRMDLYITVENIDPTQGAQEFMSTGASDLSTSLANWVEITRGVIELSAGETRKIPYLIHINLSAKPGSYYAQIQFKKGTKRSEAEASKEGAVLMLNVEVQDDANERLQLGNFISEDGVVLGDTVSFSYLLENIGNRLIEPRGSIRIFNRRGEEVGSVPLNASGEEITPDNKRQLAAAWSSSGRFGRYKAFLDLEYGENQLASVQDTVYFWIFPWKEIMVTLGGVLVLAIFGTYIVHMRSMAQPVQVRANRQKFPEVDVPLGQKQVYQQAHHIPPYSAYAPPSVYSPQQKRQSAKHVTVLRSESKLPQSSQTKRNGIQGRTVELTHRNTHKTTNVQGNVVQLQSRR